MPSIVAAERGTSPTLVANQVRDGIVVGAVLGVVNLADVHVAEAGCCESWWGEQAYAEHGGRTRRDVVHLELAHPRPLTTPIPAKGRLGLWTPDPGLVDAVLEQLVEASA